MQRHSLCYLVLTSLMAFAYGSSVQAANLGFTPVSAEETAACIAQLESSSYFPSARQGRVNQFGQRVFKLQHEVFYAAAGMLVESIKKAEATDGQFMQRYTTIRTNLFRLQMLAKLFRKAGDDQNEARFERVRLLTKEFEDRLGRFNELDELVKLIKRRKMDGTDPKIPRQGLVSVKEEWELKRASALKDLRRWMVTAGWSTQVAAPQGGLVELYALLKETPWLTDAELIRYVGRRLPKMLRKLQDEVTAGVYSPESDLGYSELEVEDKVHELRREIREIGMVMQFSGGLFSFAKAGRAIAKEAQPLLEKYEFVLDLPVAKTPFARLPAATIQPAHLVPRELFVLLTEFTLEIGVAKDWAQNQWRLHEAGLVSEGPDLNQSVDQIKDLAGQSNSFNSLMQVLLQRIQEDRPFAAMADLMETNAVP